MSIKLNFDCTKINFDYHMSWIVNVRENVMTCNAKAIKEYISENHLIIVLGDTNHTVKQ